MSVYATTYRRELTPGVVLEAHTTSYGHDEEEGFDLDHETLDSFTITVFGKPEDLLPDRLKGTEAAFSELGEKNAALFDVVDPRYKVDPREERIRNLQRWNLLPKGEEIQVTGRRVA